MKITSLENIPMSEITKCFNEGFSDYFVKFNATEKYLNNRWQGSAVDLRFSAGGWINDKLIGILITGIDDWNGWKIAYNAGTCVAPESRGNQFTQKAYEFLLPKFRAEGIRQCLLEVIQKNVRAIHVYEKIGFSITRGLECFSGELSIPKLEEPEETKIRAIQIYSDDKIRAFKDFDPCWEHSLQALHRNYEDYEFWGLYQKETLIGYAIVERLNGHIRQFAIHPDYRRKGLGKFLFSEMGKRYKTLKLNNIDDSSKGTIAFLKKIGLSIPINQFEMLMKI